MKKEIKKIGFLVFAWGCTYTVHAKDALVVPFFIIVNDSTDKDRGIFAGIEVNNKLTYKAIAPKNKNVKFSLDKNISFAQWYDPQTQLFYRAVIDSKKGVHAIYIGSNGQYYFSTPGKAKEFGSGSVVKKWNLKSNGSK